MGGFWKQNVSYLLLGFFLHNTTSKNIYQT